MTGEWLPQLDPTRCNGCGNCIARCPEQALTLIAGKATLTAPKRCAYCAACEDVCPTDAIALPFLITFHR